MLLALNLSHGFPELSLAAGDVFLVEHEQADSLFILAEGAVEVFRGDDAIAMITEPGSVFGEMSILLDIPHTASVRALTPAKVRVIANATAYLKQNPAMLFPIAQLLAQRLQSSTTYLIDLKHQFQDRADHLGMVDEVLESLTHQQDKRFTAEQDLPLEP